MRIITILLFTLLYVGAFGQDINQVKRADNYLAIPVGKKQIILNGDTSYMQQYANLEIRQDSFCLINDTCLFLLPGVSSFGGIGYEEEDRRFVLNWVDEGSLISQILPFAPQMDSLVTDFSPTIFFYDNTHLPTEPPAQTLKGFRIDNFIEGESINDTTYRLKIGHYGDQFGFVEVLHDSIDIIIPQGGGESFDSTYIYQALADSMALDLDRDPTNEGVLSFVDAGGGVYRIESNSGGATPFFNESTNDPLLDWNISGNSIAMYLDDDLSQYDNSTSGFLTSATQLWTQSGSDIYYNSGNVGIGTTNPNYDLQIGLASTGSSISDATIFTQGAGGSSETALQNRIFIGMNNNQGYGSYLGHINTNYSTGQVAVIGTRYAGIDFPAIYTRLGNVGIGTNNPSVNLDIVGNTKTSAAFEFGTTISTPFNAGVRMVMTPNAPYYGYALELESTQTGGFDRVVGGIYEEGSSYIGSYGFNGTSRVVSQYYIDIAGTKRMVVNSSGNVGIGTTSPSKKLDVVGNAEISGNLAIGDVVQGQAQSIIGIASDQTLTTVSTGTGIDLTNGTLSVDFDDAPNVLNFAECSMSDFSLTGVSNVTVGIATAIDNGNVNANTTTEEIELTEAGYYKIIVVGSYKKDIGDTDRTVRCYLEVNGVDTQIKQFQLDSEEWGMFVVNFFYQVGSTNTDLQLEFDLSGTSGADFQDVNWSVEKKD